MYVCTKRYIEKLAEDQRVTFEDIVKQIPKDQITPWDVDEFYLGINNPKIEVGFRIGPNIYLTHMTRSFCYGILVLLQKSPYSFRLTVEKADLPLNILDDFPFDKTHCLTIRNEKIFFDQEGYESAKKALPWFKLSQ